MEVFINGHKFKILIISRRSVLRAGPYHFSLGVDKDGNVANYVETEQIVLIKDFLFSFVQIRGSVPLYWSETLSYGILKQVNCLKTM